MTQGVIPDLANCSCFNSMKTSTRPKRQFTGLLTNRSHIVCTWGANHSAIEQTPISLTVGDLRRFESDLTPSGQSAGAR